MKSLSRMVLAALFTGLMVAGTLFVIPIPNVPMVLANCIPWLAALVIGPRWAAATVILYLLLGAFGLPVFAKGTSGVGTLLGNTGGFLFGYLAAALLVGVLRDPEGKSVVRNGVAVLVGLVVAYLIGIPWLAFVAFKGWDGFTSANLWQAIVWGTGPFFVFVIGDVIKGAAVVAVARAARPLLSAPAK
jgi:biotin transport system substrate-specific component